MKQSLEFALNNLKVNNTDTRKTAETPDATRCSNSNNSTENVTIDSINIKVEMEASEAEYIKIIDYVLEVIKMFNVPLNIVAESISFNPTEEPKQESSESKQ